MKHPGKPPLRQIGLNKDVIDFEKIKKANLFVIACPKDHFAPS